MRLGHHGTRFWGLLKPLRNRLTSGVVVRKVVREGARYTVAEHDGVRHVFAMATARAGGSAEEQVAEVAERLRGVMHDLGAPAVLLRQTFFVAGPELVPLCRDAVARSTPEGSPATLTEYVPQRPADGTLVALEGWGVVLDSDEVEAGPVGDQVAELRHQGMTWVHCGQVECPDAWGSLHAQSAAAFGELAARLAARGVGFEHVFRTWLYLGDIVGPEGETQRYKELNRARADFFADLHFVAGPVDGRASGPSYPASTGIGADGRGLVVGALALETARRDVQVVPLENPRQTAAFDYAPVYSPSSPKFSRAMAVACESGGLLFVSGTASITASETRHAGDAAAQTRETLDNIAALIGEDNLSQHGLPGLGCTLDDVTVYRVYVKRPQDYEAIRAICEERLGATAAAYTIADVCRDDLLVEIEAIACSSLPQG